MYLRVQQHNEVTIPTLEPRETEAILQKSRNKNQKKDNSQATSSRLRDLQEWLEEFTDDLNDAEVPALANTSQDSDSERPTNVAPRKHSIYTHFPKDTHCVICKRTKITRNPCRKRTGEAVLGAEKFGDLITADHKVLNEEGSPWVGILKACLQQAAADTRGSRTCLCAVTFFLEGVAQRAN